MSIDAMITSRTLDNVVLIKTFTCCYYTICFDDYFATDMKNCVQRGMSLTGILRENEREAGRETLGAEMWKQIPRNLALLGGSRRVWPRIVMPRGPLSAVKGPRKNHRRRLKLNTYIFVLGISVLAVLVSSVTLYLTVFKCVQHNSIQNKIYSSHGNVSSLISQINLNLHLEEENQQVKQISNENQSSKSVPVSLFKKLKNPVNGVSNYKDSHDTLEIANDVFNDVDEHVRGIQVERNTLVIEYSGLYYIYSQVTTTSNQTVYVYLHRISPNSPHQTGVLLRGVNSDPKTTDMVFIGGVFFLSSQDIIEVCLSSKSDLFISENQSFVGLFMLSSK